MAKAKPRTDRAVASPAAAAQGRVLVVEDEKDLREMIAYNLSREGFTVESTGHGEQALGLIQRDPPDLVLLDLMLPGMDGLALCRALKGDKATSHIPIVMLTAKGEETDIVVGLEVGAEDYITKPFSTRVLLARLRAVLRRPRGGDAGAGERPELRLDRLTISHERHEAKVDGVPLDLSATEFRLLYLLARRAGRVFTRQQIIDALHEGYAAVTDRSVDVQVVSLRRKLGALAERLQTVRGVGYRFAES